MIETIVFVYWLISGLVTLMIFCNIGNKDGTNPFIHMFKVLLNQYPGLADDRIFICSVSLFGGWLLVPYFFLGAPVVDWVATQRIKKQRAKIINEMISNAKANAENHDG